MAATGAGSRPATMRSSRRPLVAAGITTVVMNYALCPSVTLEEIVRQTRASDRLGLRARRRVRRRSQPPHDLGPLRRRASGRHGRGHRLGRRLRPAGGRREGDRVAISGIFDLGFVPYSYLQPKVQASWDQVERLSPQRHLPRAAPPMLDRGGRGRAGRVPPAVTRLSRGAGRGRPRRAAYLEPAGKNHLTVLEELEHPDSDLGRALVRVAHGR